MATAPPADPGKFTQKDWAVDFLTRIGAPTSPGNVAAVIAWEQAEGGHFVNNATYNPLNTTEPAGATKSINSVGVKAYPSYEAGMAATLKTITSPANAGFGYPAIVAGFQRNDPLGALNALAASKWGTGSLALKFFPDVSKNLPTMGNTAGDPANLLGATKDATPGLGLGDNPITTLVGFVAHAAAWIANRHNWVRILEVVGGAVAILVGLVALTRDSWAPAASSAAAAAAL